MNSQLSVPAPGVEALVAAVAQFVTAHAAAFAADASVPWTDQVARRTVRPTTLPVLRYLPSLATEAPSLTLPVVRALEAAAPELDWRQTYSVRQTGARFLDNYGWAELVGLSGPVPSKKFAAGFLLLGPDIQYPPHRHEALELYVPLAGEASWWRPGAGWLAKAAGTTIRHEHWEPHAMRTYAQPLLALYLWRSENLNQHAELIETKAIP